MVENIIFTHVLVCVSSNMSKENTLSIAYIYSPFSQFNMYDSVRVGLVYIQVI